MASVDFEQQFHRINRVFYPFYFAFNLACVLYYSARWDAYHFGIALGTLIIPALPELFYRLFRLRRVEQLSFCVLAFSVLGYTLGAVVDLYQRIDGFDKLVHTLSGLFVSMLCLCVYCAARPGKKLEADERLLAGLFVFLGSMAVAGLWEICEYAVHAITGRDVQRVLLTGVDDTMQDMIACLVGTLIYLPQVSRFCRGRYSPLNSLALPFCR